MAAKKADYQILHAELEAVLADLQRPDIAVDSAMQRYEQGLKLVTQLESYLKEAEIKVTKLASQAGAAQPEADDK
jgi:exodeoxyribonuclease VII small subunit